MDSNAQQFIQHNWVFFIEYTTPHFQAYHNKNRQYLQKSDALQEE